MLKRIAKKSKAIAKQLVIAFFFTTFIVFLTTITIGYRLDKSMSRINKLFTANFKTDIVERDIKLDNIKKRLTAYPAYGDAFGTIKIPSVDIDVALYHGERLEVLIYGAGHHVGSYFPGEGGTIIIAGHNTWGQFYTLPNVKVGDEVIIETTYGKYTYEITSTEIEKASVLAENLHIYNDNETIMLYTCYPVETPGYKSERFVAYGKLVGDNNE